MELDLVFRYSPARSFYLIGSRLPFFIEEIITTLLKGLETDRFLSLNFYPFSRVGTDSWQKFRKGFDGLSYLNFYDYRKLWSKLIHISDVSLWMILVLSIPCFVMLALLFFFFLWVCLISAIWGRCSCYCHFLSWCSSAVMASVKDNEDASESPSMQVSDLHFILFYFILAVVVICL